MPVTSYISVGGRMISEVTDGVILDYVPDALGSIHSVIDQDANVVKTMRYKPFGEVLSRSGTVADRQYQWVGSYGYRATFAPSSSHYVRARHYTATAGSWTTVDPLWPQESAYGYVKGRANSWNDSSGSYPRYFGGCPPKFQENMNALCDRINHIGPANLPAINSCIKKATEKRHHSCPNISLTRAKCLKRWCNSDGEIQCSPSPPGSGRYGLCPRMYVGESEDPHDTIIIHNNNPPYGFTYVDWVGSVGSQQLTVIHEVLHSCGVPHVVQDEGGREQCNDIMACCVYEVVVGRHSGNKCWERITPLPKPKPIPKPGYRGGGPPLRLP